MAKPRIIETVNTQDGMTALVRTDRDLVAPIVFTACRAPESIHGYLTNELGPRLEHSVEHAVDWAVVAGGYSVSLVDVSEEYMGARWPWFVRVRDKNGISNWSPVFICQGTDDDILTEATKMLTDVLTAYTPHLNLRLARVSPLDSPAKVRAILSGFSFNAEHFPVIDVTTAQWTESINELSDITVVGEIGSVISAYAFHESSVMWRPLINSLGMAIRDVLNQDHLLDIQLPSGIKLTGCLCTTVEVNEVQDEGGRYFTVATIRWGSQCSVPIV